MTMDFNIPQLKSSLGKIEEIQKLKIPSSATIAYNELKKQIQSFERSLDNDKEVALWVANFGQSMLIQVETIHCAEPQIIIFEGNCNGAHCKLIQHVNQLNFLLTSVPHPVPEMPRRPIGFSID